MFYSNNGYNDVTHNSRAFNLPMSLPPSPCLCGFSPRKPASNVKLNHKNEKIKLNMTFLHSIYFTVILTHHHHDDRIASPSPRHSPRILPLVNLRILFHIYLFIPKSLSSKPNRVFVLFCFSLRPECMS